MTEIALTPTQARLLHLEAQGLRIAPRRRPRPKDLVAAIQRMRLLQIDTIHVVARSPYLVLYSRLGTYPPKWLDEQLEAATIFETWAHEACFAPIEDWPILRVAVEQRHHHWAMRHAQRSLDDHPKSMTDLLDRIRAHGAVRAADFERADRSSGGWWQWKDEKRWLEAWFALGELMVARRERFQRVYDLTDRVLAQAGRERSCELARAPSAQELRRTLILRSVLALGIAERNWIADYFRLRPTVSSEELVELVERGGLIPVQVRGWSQPFFVHPALRSCLDQAAAGRLRATCSAPLSPFDPVVWDRQRVLQLFDFDYRLECYVPAAQRRYGYFVLPFLDRGRLVARIDAKMHRNDGVLTVLGVWLEPGVRLDDRIVAVLAGALFDFSRWQGGARVDVLTANPAALRRLLQQALRSVQR